MLTRYREETIKGATRIQRTKAARPIRWLLKVVICIFQNWTNFLSLSDNKVDLAHFLSEKQSQAPVKDIVVAEGSREDSI